MTYRVVIPTAFEADIDPADLRIFGALGTAGREIVEAASGEVVRLVGVNWHGAEGWTGVPGGLWTRNHRAMMDQMAEVGFNAIRLPVSPAVLTSPVFDAIDYRLNPDLIGLPAIEVLDAIVGYAGEIGLRVILDMHRRAPGVGKQEDGLWFSDHYSEARLIADWQALAGRYRGDPTVIGADLFNEPSGRARWSTLDPRTPPGDPALAWSDAAGRIGDGVLAANPDLLILVEGVHIVDTKFYWVGGNLRGVRFDPVEISDPTKLVYSPHDYPWGVRHVPWLDGATAQDMVANWRTNWAWLYEEGVAPVLIGETGSRLRIPQDALYVETLAGYLEDVADGPGGPSLTWWSWGPNSFDTGGILLPDWSTVEAEKVAALAGLLAPRLPATERAAREIADMGVEVTLSVEAPVPWDRQLRYQTLDLTARAGEDYLAEAGVLQIADRTTAARTRLTLISDDVAEGREDFLLRLSTIDGAPLSLHRVSVQDDDGPPVPEDGRVFLGSRERGPGVWDLLLEAKDAPEGAIAWRTTLVSDLFALSDPVKGALTLDEDRAAVEVQAPDGRWTNRLTAELKAPLERMMGLEEALLFARPFGSVDPRTPPELVTEGGLLYSATPQVEVTLDVQRTFGTAFFGRVTLENRGGATFEDWELRLRGPFDVTGAAKVEIVARDGGWTTLRAPYWDRDLSPGEAFAFGIDAEAELDPAAHIVALETEYF